MRGAGVLGAARRGSGVWRPGGALRAGGGVRREWVRRHRAPRRLQALQPAAGRDLRVRARRPRLQLPGGAGRRDQTSHHVINLTTISVTTFIAPIYLK